MTETEFIKQLKLKSENAYHKLLDDFQQKVFGTCISFVPNKEDAEDIAQEVFVEVFNSINGFKGNSKLTTWIYRITTNKCLEFIRKKKAKKRLAQMKLVLRDDAFTESQMKYFDLKSQIAINDNNYKEAFESIQSYYHIKSDFVSESVQKNITELEKKYETEKKEHEIKHGHFFHMHDF